MKLSHWSGMICNKMIKPKYRIGQVVKFETTLKNGKKEQIFGQIVSYCYDQDGKKLRYSMDEYPEKSDIMWHCPEDMLSGVTLQEI